MKKIFRKAFALIAISAMSIGVTSCDSETLTQLLPYILQMLMGGQAQTYSGSAELMGLEYSTEIKNDDGTAALFYMKSDSIKTVNNIQATVQVQQSGGQSVATITVPTLEIGGRVITNLQVAGVPVTDGILEGGYQWAYTCNRQYGTEVQEVSVTEQNQATYHYDLIEGYVKSTSENTATLYFYASVYMGSEVYNVKYTGTLIKQ